MVGIGTKITIPTTTTTTTTQTANAAVVDKGADKSTGVELGTFLLSQSGNVMPGNYGNGPSTPVADPKRFARLEIKALDPAGVNVTAKFDLDERGAPRPNSNQRPLGHVPYQVTLVGHDGERFSAVVDIRPSRVGVGHSTYETMSSLKLTAEAKPKAPPASVALGAFMITQSGRLMPEGYGNKPVAMFPPGFTDHVEVMALDANKVHTTARFAIDARGMIRPDANQPALGDVPFRLTTTDVDGHRYSADIDVTRAKIKVSHTGYEQLSGVTLTLVTSSPIESSAPSMAGVASDFVKQQSAPKTGMSPLELLLKR